MPRVATCVVLLSFLALASSAFSQIIYEPVQYQYSANGTLYYYGGSNPYVHKIAREPVSPGGTWGRINGHAFVGANRVVDHEPLRVFTDGWGYGLRNAHNVGFTPADAYNDAQANLPRYFVKRDLLNAAVRRDGAWVVPAQAKPVLVYKSNGELIEPRPATLPRPLLIIPRDALKNPPGRPDPKPSDKQMARAG